MLSPHVQRCAGSGRWRSADEDEDAGFPCGGMIVFHDSGGMPAVGTFLTATCLLTLAESLGGVESLAEQLAHMTLRDADGVLPRAGTAAGTGTDTGTVAEVWRDLFVRAFVTVSSMAASDTAGINCALAPRRTDFCRRP